MKQLVVLPGNSPKNRAWGKGIVDYYGGIFDAVHMQLYDHWETGDEVINFDAEAEKLKQKVSQDNEEYEYYVFAKSFGSILALLATHRGCIRPKKCVFFGLPLNLVKDEEALINEWSILKSFSIPTIAFHNEDDPVADYTFTKTTLTELNVSTIALIVTEGDNHSYTEYEVYEDRIKGFLKT